MTLPAPGPIGHGALRILGLEAVATCVARITRVARVERITRVTRVTRVACIARVTRVALVAVAVLVAASVATTPALAVDYCIDPVTGSDAASGVAPDCWATFLPTTDCPSPLQAGDRVLLSEGRHAHPLTAWYVLPGVQWIGAGRDATSVAYVLNVGVPFVRFVQGSAGSGPACDRRAATFGPDTLLADMTIVNEGRAAIGIEILTSSGVAEPTLARLGVEGFPTGISVHPASDERDAPTTRPVLTQSTISGATDAGIRLFSDVFYARTVTEASVVENCFVQSDGAGIDLRTLISYVNNFDPADAVLSSTLTSDTVVGGAESAVVLSSWLDDGTGERLAAEPAAVFAPSLAASIFTGSQRYGLEERSGFVDAALLRDTCLGGNALGDVLDEGASVVTAESLGAGNTGDVPLLVDPRGGDLHQLAGSPTIDRIGVAATLPQDVDGHARPMGADADMGADEWVPCSATADASASEPAEPCFGAPSILDATRSSIDASACPDGMAYEWIDPDGAVVSRDAVVMVSPSEPTTYRLVVRCADPALSGCRDETIVDVVPSPAPPVVDAGEDVVACADDGVEVAVDLVGIVEAVAPATITAIEWTSDGGTLDDPTSETTTLRITAGAAVTTVTATLRATDSNGCVTSDDIVVQVAPNPRPTIEAPPLTCHDPDAATLTIPLSVTVPRHEPPFTHEWSTTLGTITGDASATLELAGDAAARTVEVSVVVTDALGCRGSASQTLRVVPRPRAEAGADTDDCAAPGTVRVPLDGTASSGASVLSHAWTSDIGTVLSPTEPMAQLELPVGSSTLVATVRLTITDEDGCTAEAVRQVTLRPEPRAAPGGPYTAVASGGPSDSLALDGTLSSGEGILEHAWTTDLGTFEDTGTVSSALASPVLVVPAAGIDQRGTACLTVTSENGCTDEACAPVSVLLEPPLPPNDVGWTLRLAKSPPDDVVITFEDAPVDATHDRPTSYETWVSETACGPFDAPPPLTVPRVAGTNTVVDPVLASAPPRRFYRIVSLGDGGRSEPAAPDGSGCP